MKKIKICFFILLFISNIGAAQNYVFWNYAIIFSRNVAIGYQREIHPKQTIGAILRYNWSDNSDIFGGTSVYATYNFFTKETFYGWWFMPGLGFEYEKDVQYMPLIAGIGYHWITPIGISLGFNIAPGYNFALTNKQSYKSGVCLFGIADIGFRF